MAKYTGEVLPQEGTPYTGEIIPLSKPPVDIGTTPKTEEPSRFKSSGFYTGNINIGIANALGLPVDTVENILNLGRAAVGTVAGMAGRPELMPETTEGAVGGSEWIKRQMAERGMIGPSAVPQTGPQRFGAAALQGVGGAAIPLSPSGAAPGTMARTMAGGAMAGLGAEAGHEIAPTSPVVPMLGAMVPGAASAAARGVAPMLRGSAGIPPPPQVRQRVQRLKETGIPEPGVGLATGSRTLQGMENILAAAPGGSSVMTAAGERRIGDFKTKVQQLADLMSPKGATIETAGRTIKKGIEEGFLQRQQAKQAELWNALDKYIKPTEGIDVSKTRSTLEKLALPKAGARATTESLINQKIRALYQGLEQDLRAGTTARMGGRTIELPPEVRAKLGVTAGTTLPYEAVKDLRTRVGELLDSTDLVSDTPRKQLKQLYGALSEDMKTSVYAKGKEARYAFDRANTHTRAMHERIDRVLENLTGDKAPEKVFNSAMSGTKEGASSLRSVMRSLTKEERNVVTSYVVRRMGKASPGTQDDMGETFSIDKYVTDWNKLSPEAKSTLFSDPKMRSDMDLLAKTASEMKEAGRVFINPSGTARMGAKIAYLTEFLREAAVGNFKTAAGIAMSVGANYGLAKAMTSPKFVEALATARTGPPGREANLARNLALFAKTDPNIRDFLDSFGPDVTQSPPGPIPAR